MFQSSDPRFGDFTLKCRVIAGPKWIAKRDSDIDRLDSLDFGMATAQRDRLINVENCATSPSTGYTSATCMRNSMISKFICCARGLLSRCCAVALCARLFRRKKSSTFPLDAIPSSFFIRVFMLLVRLFNSSSMAKEEEFQLDEYQLLASGRANGKRKKRVISFQNFLFS